MMIRKAEIIFELEYEPGVSPSHSDKLEVSLPCAYCQRNTRTVWLNYGDEKGKCCPGSAKKEGEHPPFSGRITSIITQYDKGERGHIIWIYYKIEYEFEDFEDTKYAKRSDPCPFWARTTVTFYCASCHEPNEVSTQSNLTRPWSQSCSCGKKLMAEYKEPRLRLFNPDTNEWEERPSRWNADDFQSKRDSKIQP